MYEHLRQHHRVSLTTELWIGQDGIFTRTDELLQNLSVGGAFVHTGQVFAIGAILSFRFRVPNVVNFVSCTALVRNMVVGDGLGVQFLDLSSENVRHIEQYVKSTLEPDTQF